MEFKVLIAAAAFLTLCGIYNMVPKRRWVGDKVLKYAVDVRKPNLAWGCFFGALLCAVAAWFLA